MGDAREKAEATRQQNVIDEAQRLTGGNQRTGQRPSLPKLIDNYLAEQDRRHAISQSNPESLPSKRRLSHAGIRSIKSQLRPFKDWAEKNRATLGDSSGATEAMLRKYRAHCDDRTGNSKLASQFLAHADGRTARLYIDQRIDPHQLETDALDMAIEEMEGHFKDVIKP